MCQSVWLIDERREVHTAGEMKLVCDGFLIPADGYGDDINLDSCLCQVDVPNTLLEAGYRVSLSDKFFFEYSADRLPTEEQP